VCSQEGNRVSSSISICGRIIGVSITLMSLSQTGLADERLPTSELIDQSIRKSLPLLERGAKGSLEQRKQCFNCHNQGLPVMALLTARSRGFPVDSEHLKAQLQFTADFLSRNKQRYREGEGQNGQVDTAGYALWTLDRGGWQPDDTTTAVAEYLLVREKDQDHWEPDSNRPPSEQSLFTSTFLALRGLKVFGIPEQIERIDNRIERARQWLLKSIPQETEDLVFRLRALRLIEMSEEHIRQATSDLEMRQRDDGGWAQTADMLSDPYATGTALVALYEAGDLDTDDPVYRKGMAFLISAQLEDGSWHVVSRAKPFQTYFESGYPHGKDQFISIAAASWSTTALALALPRSPDHTE
jgi:Squalene-hopene cyclase C-terminal domain